MLVGPVKQGLPSATSFIWGGFELKAGANGIEIWYQALGDPSLPALLLLMGAGAQSLYWPEPFCQMLAGGGYNVIRYDHRDLGESTWISEGPESWGELRRNPPYALADMTADALGLLDALGIRQAHFVGAWLGGVLTEVAAGVAPERILSATLIGATPPLPQSQFDDLWATMEDGHRPVESTPELIEQGMAIARASAGPGFTFEEARLRALWTEMAERGNRRMARARHVSAGFFSPRPGPMALANSHVPLLILEGTAERGYQGMVEYSARVPHSRFVPIEGLGHELPSGAWRLVADEVLSHMATSSRAA
jgi:pimeloyl-ACP methyl ester carboxylesterase